MILQKTKNKSFFRRMHSHSSWAQDIFDSNIFMGKEVIVLQTAIVPDERYSYMVELIFKEDWEDNNINSK